MRKQHIKGFLHFRKNPGGTFLYFRKNPGGALPASMASILPRGHQEAPRRHPGGSHLRFSLLVQAVSGINFLTFSIQKWGPRLQKELLGTTLGHLQLQRPKNHKTITSGAPQNDTRNHSKVIRNNMKNKECFPRVPDEDICSFL